VIEITITFYRTVRPWLGSEQSGAGLHPGAQSANE
jgi:hypothetical protein